MPKKKKVHLKQRVEKRRGVEADPPPRCYEA